MGGETSKYGCTEIAHIPQNSIDYVGKHIIPKFSEDELVLVEETADVLTKRLKVELNL